MNIKDYQEIINKTAVYPQSVDNFGAAYALLGLSGETVEFLSVPRNDAEAMTKELGDCYWYLAALCNELGFTLDAILPKEGTERPELPENFKDAQYVEVMRQVMVVYNYVHGTLSELLKKHYRDGKVLDKNTLYPLLSNFGMMLEDLAYINKLDRAEVLEVNYNKLMKRRETDTLHGDGDNREEEEFEKELPQSES